MESDLCFVAVNGARLAYRLTGDGPPVVLIHGFTLDHRMWDAQIAPLAARYRLLRYDARGFGRSDSPIDIPYANVDDLRALLDALGIERAHIAGLSMGGGIAVDFALTYPERVRTLTVIDAAINGWPWSADSRRWQRPMDDAVRTRDRAAVLTRWLDHPLFAPALEQPAVAERLRAIVGDYSGRHWFESDAQRSPQPPAIERLAHIGAPTLVVVGERDLPDFRACADLLHERIPDARLVVVPSAGHMVPMEEPDAFNAALLAFLNEH